MNKDELKDFANNNPTLAITHLIDLIYNQQKQIDELMRRLQSTESKANRVDGENSLRRPLGGYR